jgi:L-ascorbate metabolism protein UlaG (beta-lactamase superfamily)
MKLKWLGHASWKLNTGDKVIYMDPYRGEYDEKADIVLASHSHNDHCEPNKISLVYQEGTTIIAPPSCAKAIGELKIEGDASAVWISLKPGEKQEFDDVTVEAVEAYNVKRFRSPGKPFHPKGLGVGYVIEVEGKRIYHVGDSDFIDEMKKVEDVDILLIPSGGTYTMDNEDAAEATIAIKPKVAIPMHIWDTNPVEYKKKVEAGSDVKVILMHPGDTYEG